MLLNLYEINENYFINYMELFNWFDQLLKITGQFMF